jgi:hypothetical protein
MEAPQVLFSLFFRGFGAVCGGFELFEAGVE